MNDRRSSQEAFYTLPVCLFTKKEGTIRALSVFLQNEAALDLESNGTTASEETTTSAGYPQSTGISVRYHRDVSVSSSSVFTDSSAPPSLAELYSE